MNNHTLCNIKKCFTILLCTGLLASCNNASDNAEGLSDSQIEIHGDTLTIPSSSTIASRIVCDTVGESSYAATLTTTGVVTAIPSSYAEVAAPFGGRVVRSLVRIGQKVKAGTPLFEISSSDYGEVVKRLIQTKSEMDMAKRALDRTQDLHNNKVASDKDLDEAKTAYSLAAEEYHHAVAVANEYQIDIRHAEVGQPMIVRSPISGSVLTNDLVIGDSVLRGQVSYVGGVLDPETRTVQTIIECNNPRHFMLPNMYAQVRMHIQNHNSLIIPKDAVLQSEKGRYVLLQIGKNTYRRTFVEVQSVDERNLRVL